MVRQMVFSLDSGFGGFAKFTIALAKGRGRFFNETWRSNFWASILCSTGPGAVYS